MAKAKKIVVKISKDKNGKLVLSHSGKQVELTKADHAIVEYAARIEVKAQDILKKHFGEG